MKPSGRRVVITGIGTISPLGLTPESTWTALAEQRSGVRQLESLPTDALPVGFGGEAIDFTGKIGEFGDLPKVQARTIRKALRMMCRECQMGVAAGQRALLDADITEETVDPLRIGISYNSDYMITLPEDLAEACRASRNGEGEFDFSKWAGQGLPQMNPLWQLKYLPNMPAAHLAIFNQLRGPNNSVTMREAGVGAALGEAFHIVAEGRADLMLVGGTGTRIHPTKTVHAFQTEELARNGAPEQASRPFDRDRQGMVMGEGAGALIIESFEHAQARGATVHAEVLGGSYTAAMSRDRVADRRLALANAMRHVLTKTGVVPEDIGHINAHGLGTRQCDIEEAQAINDVFGDRADTLPVTAVKSYFGNLGGGSGFVELGVGVESLKRDALTATLNFETPDAECPVRIAEKDAPAGRVMLKLAVSPQGQAGAVLLTRYEG